MKLLVAWGRGGYSFEEASVLADRLREAGHLVDGVVRTDSEFGPVESVQSYRARCGEVLEKWGCVIRPLGISGDELQRLRDVCVVVLVEGSDGRLEELTGFEPKTTTWPAVESPFPGPSLTGPPSLFGPGEIYGPKS